MKNYQLTLLWMILCLIPVTAVNAQSGANSAGIIASGSGGKVSASVGQVFTNTNSSGSHYAVEGVQQPYEISVITSNEELNEIAEQITVYPNPFIDAVNIKFGNSHGSNNSYVLMDINSKPVKQGMIDADETVIDGSFLSKGTYILSILNGNALAKSFKIIKN